MALGQILLMQGFDPRQVMLEEGDARGGEGRETVLIAFPRPDGQLLEGVSHVLAPLRWLVQIHTD
jgi:hypothetical protein